MQRRFMLCALVAAALAASAAADTELVLIDGTVLSGTDVVREEGNYVLTLESGDEIVLPLELVETVRLKQKGEPRRRTDSGYTVGGRAEIIAGQEPPEGPTGFREGEPETLAGRPVRPPRRDEQLGALGPPARFAEDVVHNDWVPTTDWDLDPENTNNFAPSTWAEGPVDPTWRPSSAFDADTDELESGRSEWAGNVIDPSWTPTDGFKK